LLTALGLIRDQLEGLSGMFIRVYPHEGVPQIDIQAPDPAKAQAIEYVTSQHSEIMPTLFLIHSTGGRQPTALFIHRQPGKIMDEVTVNWTEWAANLPESVRSQVFVKAMALARKHLRAIDAEASLSGGTDSAWTQYRDAQQAILSSLEETSKSVLVQTNRRLLEAEATATAKYAQLERALTEKFDSEKGRLATEHADRMKLINDREEAMKQREQSFNTKEARYVARQGQQKQIEDITKWLSGWNLTKGTTKKWWMVTGFYGLALLLTGILTFWFSAQSFQILKSAPDLTKIAWWQWLVLSMKSILPLAAFITFLVYLIRWSSVWARQHAEEEFRNRARVLDIGRSAWLLEAVRDAHDNKSELPPELFKELSKNLFTYSAGPDASNLYPEAIGEILAQVLSSIRIKSKDIEIEAKSGKEK
jgi:hypothetical protein